MTLDQMRSNEAAKKRQVKAEKFERMKMKASKIV